MTNPEATHQDAETSPESATPEATHQDAEASPESSTDEVNVQEAIQEAGEEAAAADYQTRMEQFDKVESTPVVSMPVESSQQLGEDDLKVSSPDRADG